MFTTTRFLLKDTGDYTITTWLSVPRFRKGRLSPADEIDVKTGRLYNSHYVEDGVFRMTRESGRPTENSVLQATCKKSSLTAEVKYYT
jgi:hypothetical protein